MQRTAADLLQLQGNIKRDPASYSDEFGLQWRHYKACLALFLLKPSQDSHEFAELVTFIAQVSPCYPTQTAGFAEELMGLLEQHHALLDPSLRQSLVKALILLRNRGQLSPTALLPLLFKLFRVQDKALRQLVFRHVTADIKNSNRKGRNERLNRAVQNFMYSVLQDEHEGAAKKGLAVMTEMWRRHIWRDARTVNVIASAALHKSSRIMLAALKFFLGQDEAEDKGDGSDSEGEDKAKPTGPTKEEMYSAFHKGTLSTKKKKQKKIKRMQAAVKRAERREEGGRQESFAALQLLHDPQGFAEKLFSRLQGSTERFETRLALMMVISRCVGVHKLLLLNFYPFLQKYIAPQQREVTHVLAALVQACHDLVPPDVLAPVIRQLVDQFVHDRARPEVVTIGIKTVREICTRSPLVMTPELLQDLTAYKKYRNKAVSSAARGLISLFRELAPGMLEKKDRGRGADMARDRMQYGAAQIADRIEGAELLEEALRTGLINSDGELVSESEGSGSDSDSDSASGSGSEDEEEGGSGSDSGREEEREEVAAEEGAAAGRAGGGGGEDESDEEGEGAEGHSGSERGWSDVEEGSGSELELEEGSGDEEEEEGGSGSDAGSEEEEEEEAGGSGREVERDEEEDDEEERPQRKKQKRQPPPKQQPQADSMAVLKKRLAAAKAGKQQQPQAKAGQPEEAAAAGGGKGVPLEWGRILSEEDFERIRQLKHRRLVEQAMQKHGLKSASKREKARAAAEEEAEELLELKDRLGVMSEHRVNPDDLLGSHKYRKDKEERLAAVMAGREGRDFGAKSKLKKKKSGGLSNREKDRRKRLPLAARSVQAKRRVGQGKKKPGKNFKGHVKKR